MAHYAINVVYKWNIEEHLNIFTQVKDEFTYNNKIINVVL